MRPYGFSQKEYGEDSMKASGWYGRPVNPSTGLKNILRRYKKVARRLAKITLLKEAE
jgi:hypothetical protein